MAYEATVVSLEPSPFAGFVYVHLSCGHRTTRSDSESPRVGASIGCGHCQFAWAGKPGMLRTTRPEHAWRRRPAARGYRRPATRRRGRAR